MNHSERAALLKAILGKELNKLGTAFESGNQCRIEQAIDDLTTSRIELEGRVAKPVVTQMN
jgi:hypothetical protein